METIFNGNIVVLFFFAMIAIFNYTELKEYQRIAIIYITVYALAFFNMVSILLAIALLFSAMFCFLEILIKDDTKFKIVVNPIYKTIDCVYLSFFQYEALPMLASILMCHPYLNKLFTGSSSVFKTLSFVFLMAAVTGALKQKFVICSFNEMYKVFRDYPINRVDFNTKLETASNILISIEDRTYFERKGYTYMSFDAAHCVLKRKIINKTILEKWKCTFELGNRFIKNSLKKDRGYSTIPMQLVRSLGIKRGYNYTFRRKIFELFYSRIFFEGIKNMFKEDQVVQREHIKKYYVYIYFHQVNTFLGDATFSKFLNAFDMQYSKKNVKDIYDCSNEGIFIACMGLSRRATDIDESNIEYFLSLVDEVELNK